MNVKFLVFTLLFFSQAEGAKKCYYCADPQCKDVKEQTCKPQFMCQGSYEFTDFEMVQRRQCVLSTEDNRKTCEIINLKSGSQCYDCYEDLCNTRIAGGSSEYVEGNIVTKCYTCEGRCDNPEIETCESKSESDYLCVYATNTTDNTIQIQLSCAINTEEVKQSCEKINEQSSTTCSVCDEDLCNKKSFIQGGRAGNATDINFAPAMTYSAPAMLLTVLVSLLLVKF